MTSKKDKLLSKSRAIIEGRRVTSLADFQDTPTGVSTETPSLEIPLPEGDVLQEDVRTKTYKDVLVRTSSMLPRKTARENFRFTEKLAFALGKCATEKRMKKNIIVEIALENYLKTEGYL
jgi:hypothetical protein